MKKLYFTTNSNVFHFVLLCILLAVGFYIRIKNLDYNVPFNDEAIYIVVGKMGVFLRDWWSYNAKSWMAGLPYIYPTLTALAYQTGGIAGSRFLSALFGIGIVAEVYQLTSILFKGTKQEKWAALIAALCVAFSTLGLYISRLATYDAPCFFFLLLGINYLLRARGYRNGRYYFVAAICVVLAFYTKIVIAAYVPFLAFISYWPIRKNASQKRLWWRYFTIPITVGVACFLLIDYQGFLTYTSSQINREHIETKRIVETVWLHGKLFFSMAALSLPILWIKRRFWITLALSAAAFLIPVIHIVNHRLATLDKHTFLTVLFLSPLIGFAAANLLTLRPFMFKIGGSAIVCVVLAYYSYQQVRTLPTVEGRWYNAYPMLDVLRAVVKPTDKILTEEGADTILGLYEKLPPTQVSTFDWFDYMHLTGDASYIQAVHDGYFNYIELDGQAEVKQELVKKLRQELPTQYHLIFKESHFEIYERNS